MLGVCHIRLSFDNPTTEYAAGRFAGVGLEPDRDLGFAGSQLLWNLVVGEEELAGFVVLQSLRGDFDVVEQDIEFSAT